MNLKEKVPEIASGDLYYDFFDGGYLEPEQFLASTDDIARVHTARVVLKEYFELLEDVVEEM